MMSIEPTIADLAAYYRRGVSMRFIDPSEVVRWADEIIRQETNPDVNLVEVSLSAANPTAMVEHLTNLSEGANRHVVRGMAIRRLGDYLIHNQDQARDTVIHIEQICREYEWDIIDQIE